MKWLVQTFAGNPEAEPPAQEDMANMIQQMKDIDDDLRATSELVLEQGLDEPKNGYVVTADEVRAGSQAPPHKSVQGLWIVDVESEVRAIEIAKRISAIAFGSPIEVRRCVDAPPD